MTYSEALSNVTFGLAMVCGLLLIGGFLFVANTRDARNAKHPGGVRGRIRDELIVLAPMMAFLCMVSVGWLAPDLRDAAWWSPALFALALIGLGFSFTPPVQRARQRLSVLRGDPAQ